MGEVPAGDRDLVPDQAPCPIASDSVSDRLGDPADAFRLALAHVPHGLCMFDADKRLILCNKAYAEMYRLPPSLAERGTPLGAILDHRRAVGNAPADPDTYFDVVMMARRSGRHEGARVRLVDGRTIQITHNPMPDCGYVAVHEDVTAYVDVEDRLRYLAGHDQLTGLRNRHAFAETFAATLATARPGVDIALHYLDLDRFKAVNDAFGHDLGDMLLQKVAKRLTMCASHRDVVGRIGGDEFVILQPMVDGKLGATDMASRVIEAVAQPYRLTGHQVSVGVSIGITLHPAHGSTPDRLLKNADRALYEAKAQGGNAACVFRPTEGLRRRSRTISPMEEAFCAAWAPT